MGGLQCFLPADSRQAKFGGGYRMGRGLRLSLCTGELNAIRKHRCFLCSPFCGRACRWAMLGELKPQGPKGSYVAYLISHHRSLGFGGRRCVIQSTNAPRIGVLYKASMHHGSSKSSAAIQKEAGLFCGSFPQKGEVYKGA